MPKSKGTKKSTGYRTISLMTRLLKVFLKIIVQNGLGTRDTLFSIPLFFQRCIGMNCSVYGYLDDYLHAFKKIRHNNMMKVLQDSGVLGKEICIVKNP